MALLRNLRNILQANVSPAHIERVASHICDPAKVAKSKQLPFRFLAAYKELMDVTSVHTASVLSALENAVRESVNNLEGFEADTSVLVAADGAADAKEALTNVAMQVAAMNPQYISRDDISQAEIDKMRDIIVDSSLNDPASLPKPILNALISKACNEKVWSDEDIAIYEEKKSNMNFLFNFLSDAAKASLAGLAMADKANIVAEKMFNGAVEGRVSKQLKEICLLDQAYVKAEDGKQTVAAYLKSVNGAIVIKKAVRFEVGEGMEKKSEDFAAEVAAQMAGK